MLLYTIVCFATMMGESRIYLAVIFNLLAAVYLGVRVSLGKFGPHLVAYGGSSYTDYLYAFFTNTTMTYFVIYQRKANLLEESRMKLQSRNWKEVLQLMTDSVVICDKSGVMFKNSAMNSLLLADSSPTDSVLPLVLTSACLLPSAVGRQFLSQTRAQE